MALGSKQQGKKPSSVLRRLLTWNWQSITGLPRWSSGKESNCQCRRCKRLMRRGFNPWGGKIVWRKKRQPTPVFLPGQFHGQRSPVGYCLWDHKESGTAEHMPVYIAPLLLCSVVQNSHRPRQIQTDQRIIPHLDRRCYEQQQDDWVDSQ